MSGKIKIKGIFQMTTFGFIGTGHLGSMLIEKFVETGAMQAEDVMASNRTPEKAMHLAKAVGIRAATNRAVAGLSDVIFICVRPLEVRDVVCELADLLNRDKLLVSVAGDVSLYKLKSLCQARLARAFPSIASQKLQGVTLLSFADNATTEDRTNLISLFRAIGYPAEVDEMDFPVLADLTSCAPGYFAAIMREFSLAAERKGVSAELAERLVRQTMLGTAMLLDEENFAGLIEKVATRGGITEAGIKVIRRDAPCMFDQLFQATEARHEQVKKSVDGQR